MDCRHQPFTGFFHERVSSWGASFFSAFTGFLVISCGLDTSFLLCGHGGCGVLSLVASRYGFRHIVTSDIVNDALQFARANVLRNNLQDLIDVCYLDVSRPGKDERFPEGFDRIVASELLYLDDLHRPLLKFVDRHLAPGGKAVFCTDMARAKPHFAKLAARTFQVQEGHIGVKSQDGDGNEQRRIYVLHILERKQ